MQDFSDKAIADISKFWTAYKIPVISGFLLIIAALWGQARYAHHCEEIAASAAEHYYTYTHALERDDTATQQRSLSELKKQSPAQPYGILAHVREAAYCMENQDWDRAQKELLYVEQNSPIPTLKMMAQYKRAEIAYIKEEFDEALAILEPIDAPELSLKEHLKARIFYAQGDKERALKTLESLLETPNLDKAVQASWTAQYQALALEENLV